MAAKVDLKVVLLGKEYGGKTSLVERFLHGKFGNVPYQSTIGAAFGAKSVTLANGSRLTLGIWVELGMIVISGFVVLSYCVCAGHGRRREIRSNE
jgi:Ras-related protein Rab-24